MEFNLEHFDIKNTSVNIIFDNDLVSVCISTDSYFRAPSSGHIHT